MKKVCIFLSIVFAMFGCRKTAPDNEFGSLIRGGALASKVDAVTQSTLVADGGSCTTTPQPGTWYIKSEFLQNYVHFCQLDAKPEYPGGVLCGPVSYMLGTHMLAVSKGKGWLYPSSKVQAGNIYTKLKAAGKFDDTQGMYLSDVVWFCRTYDNALCTAMYKRTTDRASMKEFLEYWLKTGCPIVVTVDIFGRNQSLWSNNDADFYDQVGKTYYISKNGTIGHFILLVGIKINADGSGTVYYKDPLSASGTTQSASYTRMLDAMKSNGNTDYYDAISLSLWKLPSTRNNFLCRFAGRGFLYN